MSKPVAVITGDVHFTIPTLELASKAVEQCIDRARKLNVPLVLNGDLLDGKALVRAECANRLIELLEGSGIDIIINRGNHDQLSERSDEHALNFLKPYAQVIATPTYIESIHSYVLPYQHDMKTYQSWLDSIPKGSRLVIHQGVQGAKLGHYVIDKSSLPLSAFANFRTLASHYHCAQDIKAGPPRKGAVGLFSYIGTPYTITFAEANDGPKGFRVLMDDGTLDFVPTNLRKHIVLQMTLAECAYYISSQKPIPNLRSTDLIWLKLSGPITNLHKVNKEELGQALFGRTNYKLDKIYTDSPDLEPEQVTNKTGEEILDNLIDSSDDSKEQKEDLKALWREIL